MTILVSTLGVWLVTLALLFVAGYGLSRWLTPAPLRPYELLLVPLWGYALLVFIAYYGLNTILTLRAALPVALVLALALGAWRIVRPGAHDRLPRTRIGESVIVAALGLLSGLLGVVPLLRAGYLMPIGHGWDIEFYLPLAAYLQDWTYTTLPQAPPAPLLNVILAEPTSVRAIGFSYLQGLVDLIGRWSPVGTFPLLLALLKALAVIPMYLLLRVGLRAGIVGAAVGTLLVAANELLLWISYNNFAMQVSSMPLVPLATLLTLLALEGQRSTVNGSFNRTFDLRPSTFNLQPSTFDPALAGAIAATTALTLSYHPALLAYGALAGGIGGWALIASRDKLATILRGATILFGTLALGALANWRAPQAFFDVYAAQTPSLGGNRFPRLTELAGVEAFHHLALAVDQPVWVDRAGWVAVAALALGIVAAIWRGALRRGPALGMLAFALLYTLGLRFVIAFPYGFFKGVSYLSFAPLGLAGVGLVSIMQQRRRVPRIVAAALGGAAIALVVSMTGWSTYRLLQTYRAPVLASADVAAFTAALRKLPDAGSVLLVDQPELRGPTLGIATLGLYGHPWIGRGQTGFTLFNRPEPGSGAAYALMSPGDDPRAWGFAPGDAIARSRTMVLYRAPAGSAAFLSGNAAFYARAGGSLRQRLNSLQVQDLTHGDYRTIQPDRALQLFATPDRLSWEPPAPTGARQSRVVSFEVANDAPQQLTIASPTQTQTFALARGVSRITTAPIAVPATLELKSSSAPLIVRSAQLWTPDAQQTGGVAPMPDTISVATATQVQTPTIQTTIRATSAGSDVLHVGLELYEISEQTPRRYAGGSLAVRANEPATLTLDLQQVTATLNGGPVALTTGDVRDGEYFAALWLYQGNTLARRVPFVRFVRRDGQISDIQRLDANATFALLLPTSQRAATTIGPAQLTGYDLSPQPARPGSDLQLSLDWTANAPSAEPLLVFAQILGPDDRKWAAWDGAAGGAWWPSPAWQAGDRIRQAIPLRLDPATPPGRYRLVVGLYNARTGARLPVSGPQARGDLALLQVIEVRP